jgi:F-type H+-transporting ATPase subunit c
MKTLKVLFLVVVVLMVTVAPALAYTTSNKVADDTVQSGGPDHAVFSGAGVGAGLGAAFIMIGAGYGFGRIGSAALESMARQPEVANRIQVAMIIIAALLEGATFFGLLICMTVGGKATW